MKNSAKEIMESNRFIDDLFSAKDIVSMNLRINTTELLDEAFAHLQVVMNNEVK